jgi:cobyrinic acid a,c-diamide synthase
MSSVPCLVIGGTHSGVGKTTVAIALMIACVRRGLRVQAFKVGPDFIDPSFHRAATGRASHNLDGWLLSRDANLALYRRASEGADLSIVEGVMGLFDGRTADDESGSTAEMAKWLGAPVVLVVDGAGMARSAAALVHGFESFDPELGITGVIFNRVSSEKHFAYLRESLRGKCNATPLGYLSTEPTISLPERHLGLHLADEVLTPSLLESLSDWIERTVNLDGLLTLARSAKVMSEAPTLAEKRAWTNRVRIAVAKDRAFQFYYDENLRQLQENGADLVEYSPIDARCLPDDVHGLYLGGGYPELHAAELAANTSMRQSIRSFAQSGAPIYAECGGFMYLTEGIVDADGRYHEMCGIFPTRARMGRRLSALGYADLETLEDVGWLSAHERMRGHEFRYSAIDEMPASVPRVYNVHNVSGSRLDGFLSGTVLGSYLHIHFGSCPTFAERFVAAASARRKQESPQERNVQI